MRKGPAALDRLSEELLNPREFVAQRLRVRGQTPCHAGDQQGHARQDLSDAVMQLRPDSVSLTPGQRGMLGLPAARVFDGHPLLGSGPRAYLVIGNSVRILKYA